MGTKLGDYCARCGAKSTRREENGKLLLECPNRHGIQRIEDLPADAAAEEPAQGEDRTDDVANAIDNGPGSHN